MAEILVDANNEVEEKIEGLDTVARLQKEETTNEENANSSETETPVEELPDKFQGKSIEDIARSYSNLEQQYGKQGNELGELRKLADSLIQKNLQESQTQSTADTIEQELSDEDFVLNPVEAVRKVVEESLKPIKENLTQTKVDNTLQRIQTAHPDVSEIVNDTNFQEWIMATKPRQDMWARASNGDFDYADELFTQYKSLASRKDVEAENAIQRAKEEDLKAATAISRGASPDVGSKGKPNYRRAELIRLRMENPKRYDSLSNEIRQAYAEGRVL